jgi:uncharacterized protein (TIGR03083 family)
MPSTPPAGRVYRDLRIRTSDLIADLADGAAGRPVPACPEWRVRDLVAHLVGVVGDVLTGNLDGVSTHPWTQAQIDARREVPVAGLLDEWAAKGPLLESRLDAAPGATQLIFDAATHEQDLRVALNRPGVDPDASAIALRFVARAFPQAAAGWEPLLIEPTDGGAPFRTGDGEPRGVLRGTSMELVRCLSGRRTVAQLRQMRWEGDADKWLPAFEWGPFRPPAQPVERGAIPEPVLVEGSLP